MHNAPADRDAETLGALPRAPMAFPAQDLTTAGPRDKPGLFWRLWGLIAQRTGF